MAIRPMSSKRAQLKSKEKQVCLHILESREKLCQGCGTAERLSFSHLEPKSYSLRNAANPEMIHIHCMTFGENEGCHNKYEQHRLSELNDYSEIIEALKKHAPDYLALIEDKIT
jgi:hypothetical protein